MMTLSLRMSSTEDAEPAFSSSGKRLIILGIRGVPAAHGGFETFAERLSLWLRNQGWQVTVYCQGSETGKVEHSTWNGVHRVHIPVKLSGAVGTIEFDYRSTRHALAQPATILTLGYNTGFLSLWVRARGRANYINMDGLEWKRAKYSLGPKIFLWINERLAALSGNYLIADHPAIADHLATRTKRSKIGVIPYGADGIDQADRQELAAIGLGDESFMTLIARPEPENSILEIVSAFSSRRRDCKLAVLGRYDPEVAYHAAVLAAAGPEVVFTGAIYAREKVAALRYFSLAYLHGHQVGGTNPSLVEALGAGNPIIAHDNPFNRWVAGEAGLYFSDISSCDAALTALLGDRSLQQRLGAAARERWSGHFTWQQVLGAYERLLSGNASSLAASAWDPEPTSLALPA